MRRESSSNANTTPASGALNAAAMPAAPPAASSACGGMPRAPSQRRLCCSTPAAICTDGPSLPIDRPATKPSVASSSLATASRSETNQCCPSRSSAGSCAAMTCGMPDPDDMGA